MKRTFFPLIFFSIGLSAFAQNAGKDILDIYEYDRYDANSPDASRVGRRGIVEINGTLLLRFDKKEIRRRMAATGGVSPVDFELLEHYKTILQYEVETMSLLREGLESTRRGDAPDAQKLRSLSRRMSSFTDLLLSNPQLEAEAGKAFEEWGKRRDNGSLDPRIHPRNEYLFTYLANKAANTLDRLAASDSIRFILAGTIYSSKDGSRDIHLGKKFGGPPEDVYVVPRWVFSVSEEQKNEIAQIAQLSNHLEDLRGQNIKDLKNALYNATASRACFEGIRLQLDNLKQTAATLGLSAKNQIDSLVAPQKSQLDALLSKYGSLQAGAQQLGAADLLLGFQADLGGLKSSVDQFFAQLLGGVQNLPDTVRASPQVSGLLALRDTCKANIESDWQKIAPLYDMLRRLFGSNPQRLNANLNDKVNRLAFAEIPDESKVDLTKTGRRANGDKVTIEASLQMPKSDPQPIFSQTITVQQIALYSEVKVGLILANPEPDLAEQKHQFFFAPSYSVVFKWGSRKSHFYNNFLNIGLGANFSSPDFDYDGIPEFAAAATVSTFKDFLSVGYGYNFGQDAPFWFVGFRIPFASAALPILNEIEKN